MGSPNVHYIAIGTELLNGHRLNTNAQYLGRVLAAQLGLSLSEIQAIPDDPPRLIEAINNSRADVVITSGGLGPTEDDKTTEAICSLLKCGMAFHQDSITQIKTALASRGEAVIKTAILQARYPKKAKACLNPVGLAPAFYFEHGGKKVFSLPGVPKEFTGLLDEIIIPKLTQTYNHQPELALSIYMHGVPESELNSRLREFVDTEYYDLAFLPYYGGVNLIVKSNRQSRADYESLKKRLRDFYGNKIISFTGENLLTWTHNFFVRNNLRFGACESCTGGLIINKLTSIPGSSAYIDSGIVTYSNDSKCDWLEVEEVELKKYGAVSKSVAYQMVANLAKKRQLAGAISVTGIAGPGGGSKDKPVGTVFIGAYYKNTIKVEEFHFKGEREIIQERALWEALNQLRLLICEVINNER